MTQKQFKEWYLASDACDESLAFVEACNYEPARVYRECERGDWLLWIVTGKQPY